MKLRVQVVTECAAGAPNVVEEVACIEQGTLQPETLGRTLAEAKDVLHGVQQVLAPSRWPDTSTRPGARTVDNRARAKGITTW